MFFGLPKDTLEQLQLGSDPSAFNYLNMSNCLKVDSIDDKNDFMVVRNAMKVFGITDESVGTIWKVLAGILHLGNITFSESTSSSTPVNVTNKEALKKAAKSLGVTEAALTKALTYRSISVDKQAQPQQAKKSETIFVPYDQAGAFYSRDALAKATYERMFSWLVERINESIHTNAPRREYQVIGLLDIYGFEIFKTNSFEQLNINYCNEKLQQLFIELTLKAQQEEYVREGIEWKQIDYFNNKTICDLIEKKPICIINIMDEECLMASTDASFLDKLNHNFSSHAHFQSYLTQKDRSLTTSNFRLKHYAGDVAYDVTGMLDKNKDTLFGDLVNLIVGSSIPLLKDLFLPMQKIDSKKRPESAGSQFRNAINALIQNLLACNPHYVRCIKPNDDKRSGYLDDQRVIHQIRYLGLLENVRVQRAGFAYRQEFGIFYQRYKMLCKKTWPNYIGYSKQTARDAVGEIVSTNNFTAGKEFVLGKTKIFIQNPTTLFYFEEKRAIAMPRIATLIQKIWRGYKARCEYERLKAAITLQTYMRMYRTRHWYVRTLSAIMIQKIWKGFKDRREWVKRKSAIKIQLWYRWVQSMKWLKELNGQFAEVKKDPLFGKYVKWPAHPIVLTKANGQLTKIHLKWRVESMVKSLDAKQTEIMKEKIIAYDIFHGRKAWSYFRLFEHNYLETALTPQQIAKLEKVRQDVEGNKNILFGDVCWKLNSKGAVDKRIVIVTESHFQQYKPRNLTLRGSIPLDCVTSLSMNRLEEWTVVISTKRPSKDIVINFHSNGVETASELVTVLYRSIHKVTGVLVPVVFSENIQYEHYKAATLTFQPSLNGKLSVKHVKNDAHVLYYPPGKISPQAQQQ
jgi:myosin-1